MGNDSHSTIPYDGRDILLYGLAPRILGRKKLEHRNLGSACKLVESILQHSSVQEVVQSRQRQLSAASLSPTPRPQHTDVAAPHMRKLDHHHPSFHHQRYSQKEYLAWVREINFHHCLRHLCQTLPKDLKTRSNDRQRNLMLITLANASYAESGIQGTHHTPSTSHANRKK